MAASEELRYDVRGYFTELLDKERAAKVMEVIPSVDWADLATKQDVLAVKQDVLAVEQSLRHEFRQELAALRVELYKSLAEVHKALGRQTFTLIGATCAIGGLALGLAQWL